jgi:hypothetical protein
MVEIHCGSCGLRIDAFVTRSQSMLSHQIETTVGIEDFVHHCTFVKQRRRVSGPSDCPYMKRTMDAAMADHRL